MSKNILTSGFAPLAGAIRALVIVFALIVVSGFNTGCNKGDTINLFVRADGSVDKFRLYIYDEDQKFWTYRAGEWTDATRMGKVMINQGQHGIGVRLLHAGNYRFFLLGLKGQVDCAMQPSVDPKGKGFGNGATYYWAWEGEISGNKEMNVQMNIVLHDTMDPSKMEDADCDGFPNAKFMARVNPKDYGANLADCNDDGWAATPIGEEICDVGTPLDNDCNGKVDDVVAEKIDHDEKNCGVCGHACAPHPETCVAGVCGCTSYGSLAGVCNGVCISLFTTSNCGTCGRMCKPGDVCGQVVQDKKVYYDCLVECPQGQTNCKGTCVDTATDLSNCGGCDVKCDDMNRSGVACQAGKCAGACNDGWADCDGKPANGCELYTATDAQNCGACGKICTAPNGVPACASGKCGLIGCNDGWGDCDNDVTNGCETSTNTDQNCGACGNACGVSMGKPQKCSSGKCVDNCPNGQNACMTGCADLVNDPQNCGACAKACMAQNGTPSCGMGACGVAACNGGWGNCNKIPADGCEVNLNNDTKNCGACNMVCITQNGTPSCGMGLCDIASCNPGWGNCNNVVADGCEVSLASDLKNCGACGKTCAFGANAQATCSAGKCGISCQMGWGDCDNAGNSCEANLLTEVANCGACGNICTMAQNANALCTNGTCTFKCQQGYADCNLVAGDGCEVNAQTDNNNCGGCGVKCGGNTPVCVAGACVALAPDGAPCAKAGDCQNGGCFIQPNQGGVCGTANTQKFVITAKGDADTVRLTLMGGANTDLKVGVDVLVGQVTALPNNFTQADMLNLGGGKPAVGIDGWVLYADATSVAFCQNLKGFGTPGFTSNKANNCN